MRDKADEIQSHDCHNMLRGSPRELQSIGSMGMGFVVGVYVSVTKRAGGGRFILVGANQRVREVLDITRLSTIIPLAGDFPSGLAALHGEDPAAESAVKG